MNTKTLILSSLLSLSPTLLPHSALADYRYPYASPNFYLRNYEASAYRAGLRNGLLTPNEARELSYERKNLARDRALFASDGRLTYDERRTLQRERADYDRDLRHELTDGERRW